MSPEAKNTLVSALTAVACVMVILPGALALGPVIEQWVAPVTSAEELSNITREDGKVCWKITGKKLRNAVLHSAQWSIRFAGGTQALPLVVTRNGEPPGAGSQAVAGQRYVFVFCTLIPAIPGSVLEGPPLSVTDLYSDAWIWRVRVYDTGSPWHIVIEGPEFPIPTKNGPVNGQ